jgi:hypothetical protein
MRRRPAYAAQSDAGSVAPAQPTGSIPLIVGDTGKARECSARGINVNSTLCQGDLIEIQSPDSHGNPWNTEPGLGGWGERPWRHGNYRVW